MKKLLILLLITLLASGCSVIRIEDESIDNILNTVLKQENKLVNQVANGYKYYLPKGMMQLDKTSDNIHLRYQGVSYYLYIDVISYYHKVTITYEEQSDAYFSKKLNYHNQEGYLEINDIDGYYFIEAMFNYAKMEAYVPKGDIQDALVAICYVLSSIEFNDEVLESLIGENKLNYKEEVFTIFKPKREVGNFLDYVKEYDNYTEEDKEVYDEDEIKTTDQE